MSRQDDLRSELCDLVSKLRGELSCRARAGAFAAPGGPSPRPAAGVLGPGAPRDVESSAPDPAPPVRGEEGEHEASRPEATDGSALRERQTLADVRSDLGECTRCKLAQSRQNIVFGVGDADAALMFVGEAPGADEDRLGEPFVGPAGQLLDRMIAAMGWSRDTVYIANVLKCRPPRNRDPQPDEVEACEPFLARQIDAIAPRAIVTLGKPAAHLLLGTSAPISALRGRFQSVRGIPVMPTFHPAFLLRSPDRKREAWSDLKQVIDLMSRLGIESPHPPKA